MNRRNAVPLQPALQGQVEVRRVDPDEQPRPCRQQAGGDAATHEEQPGQVPQYLDVAPHREPLHRVPRLEPGGLHLRPPDADENGLRHLFAEGADEIGAEKIPGGLSGHHPHDDAIARHRG